MPAPIPNPSVISSSLGYLCVLIWARMLFIVALGFAFKSAYHQLSKLSKQLLADRAAAAADKDYDCGDACSVGSDDDSTALHSMMSPSLLEIMELGDADNDNDVNDDEEGDDYDINDDGSASYFSSQSLILGGCGSTISSVTTPSVDAVSYFSHIFSSLPLFEVESETASSSQKLPRSRGSSHHHSKSRRQTGFNCGVEDSAGEEDQFINQKSRHYSRIHSSSSRFQKRGNNSERRMSSSYSYLTQIPVDDSSTSGVSGESLTNSCVRNKEERRQSSRRKYRRCRSDHIERRSVISY